MNYASMIEEKGLKKTFIIATLVSTLVGTFAASLNLYDRLSQNKKDSAQDDAIKKLEDKFDRMRLAHEGRKDKSSELRDSLNSAASLIRKEYDAGYNRLGTRFAIGDMVTENELQRQIIILQQTVIRVLEDALYNERQIDHAGIRQLVYASKSARNGSLDALKAQYQRLISPHPSHVVVEETITNNSREPSPRQPPPKDRPSPPSRSRHPVHPAPPALSIGLDFFCRYSVDLQQSTMPLATTFDPGRVSRCPVCRIKIDVDSDDMWEIEIPVKRKLPTVIPRTSAPAGVGKQADDKRGPNGVAKESGNGSGKEASDVKKRDQSVLKVDLTAKFIVKSHTPDGYYACALCCGPHNDYTGPVILCRSPERLIDHVLKEHRISEIKNEEDILSG